MKTHTKIMIPLIVILCLGNLTMAQPGITYYCPTNWSDPLVPSNSEQYGAGVVLGPVLDGKLPRFCPVALVNQIPVSIILIS